MGNLVGRSDDSANDYCSFYHQYCREHRNQTSLPELDRGARRMWRRMTPEERRSYSRPRPHNLPSEQSVITPNEASTSSVSSVSMFSIENANMEMEPMEPSGQSEEPEPVQAQAPPNDEVPSRHASVEAWVQAAQLPPETREVVVVVVQAQAQASPTTTDQATETDESL